MSGENPHFNRVEPENSQSETHSALLKDALFTGAGVYLRTGAADDIKTFEDIPRDKMPPKDAPDPSNPGKTIKAYSPASPPESPYKIKKEEIQLIQPGLHAWQTDGQVNTNTNYQTTYYWKDGAKPGELSLQQVETTYANSNAGAKPLGLDIPFIGLKDGKIPNVRIDIRKPTHNAARDGYDCEIASYPISASKKPGESAGYLVYVVNSFADKEGVKKRTTENIYGKDYEYLYRTRILGYEKLAADGQTPVGLLTDTFYGDPDGGTTKKLKETKYVDDKGKPTADGKYSITTIYDITQPTEVILATLSHKPVTDPATGKETQIISEIVDHDHVGTGAKYIQTFYDNQQRKAYIHRRPNGTAAYAEQYSPDGKTLTVNLYGTIPLGPGKKNGSATIILEKDNKGIYVPMSGTVRSHDGTQGTINDSQGKQVQSLNKEQLEKLMMEIKNVRRK